MSPDPILSPRRCSLVSAAKAHRLAQPLLVSQQEVGLRDSQGMDSSERGIKDSDVPGTTASSRFQKVCAATGVIVEWYDFALYAILATTLAPLFFPSENKALALMATFLIFGVSYLFRPLGGLIIGRLGDTRGRRFALVLATSVMAVTTISLTVLPTYAAIGVAAPILLGVIRALQGMSVGGQFAGAMSMLSETGSADRRGRSVAVGLATSMGGVLLAAVVTTLLGVVFTEQEILAGAWRIPYVVGCVLVIIAVFLQSKLHESEAFEEALQEGHIGEPVKDLFAYHKAALFRMWCLGVASAITAYTVIIWLPTFIASSGVANPDKAAPAAMLISGAYILVIFPLAKLGDQIGRMKLLLITAIGYVIFSIPMFVLISGSLWAYIAIGTMVMVVLQASVDSSVTPAMTEQIPTRVRFTGMAIAYNLAFIVGGFIPAIATVLSNDEGGISIGISLAIVGLLLIPLSRWVSAADTRQSPESVDSAAV